MKEMPPRLSRRSLLRGGAALTASTVVPAGEVAARSEVRANRFRRRLDLRITVNGVPRALSVEPRVTLLDALRERMQLTGAKKGCNRGECGACTVLMDGRRVNACLVLAASADGREVTTIEGLANGDAPHPVQRAFADADAFQCGFCTPGQIMSAVGCIAEGHARSPGEIREWMSGNLCRCSAYPQIVAAVAAAAGEPG